MIAISLVSFFRQLALAIVALAWVGRAVCGAESTDPPRPQLAVLVVVDQLRADYLQRWQKLFNDDGFRHLQKEGAWFQNCHFPYAFTFTGPGHASIVTGCSPDKHGIVMNDWFDRIMGESVYCVASSRHQRVPPAPADAEIKTLGKKTIGMSPERLLVPTLADALKQATGGKGRVVSLSFKDRSAILMGGRSPDACYWFDTSTGTVVTSTYYRERLHPWVEEFNRGVATDRWFGKNWTRSRTDLEYAKLNGPDDVPGEGVGISQGRTFPHVMTGGATKPGKKYLEALYNSPFGNELLLELALKAIDAERLGSGDRPDLLCVSFSCTDVVGHCWGPDSQEVLDVTLRMDDLVGRLIRHLDSKVGKHRYILALTSDHGVCPLPEVARSQGQDAARILPTQLTGQSEEFLRSKFGKKGEEVRWIEWAEYPWVYLNQRLLRERGLKPIDIETELAGWFAKQPGILAAYTRSQLVDGLPKDSLLGEQVCQSFHVSRCGDVVVLTKPYYLITPYLTGTTHGTPHSYDTHVPLLVYGPGVRAGKREDVVTPQAAAVIIAHSLGIPSPNNAVASLPADIFKRR
jgi:hypothetical protein